MKYCPPAIEECKGHFGKYSNCLESALHQAAGSMVGWADEESGDVESPYGFRWLVLMKEQTTIKAGDWDGGFDFIVAGDQYFIIVENGQGFVNVFPFDTEQDARADWAAFDAAYGEWVGDDNE